MTQRKRPSAQLRQLDSLGMIDLVRYRTDGSFIVLRPQQPQSATPEKEFKLDFSGLGK